MWISKKYLKRFNEYLNKIRKFGVKDDCVYDLIVKV